jgi:hypothetical protein
VPQFPVTVQLPIQSDCDGVEALLSVCSLFLQVMKTDEMPNSSTSIQVIFLVMGK